MLKGFTRDYSRRSPESGEALMLAAYERGCTHTPNASDSVPVLEVHNASRRFRSAAGEVRALDQVSVTAHPGDCVGLIGRSGSGKTTLLTLIGLLDRPCEGEVRVLGQSSRYASTNSLARVRRGQIGYLFQDAGLIERAKVIDTVTLPMAYAGVAKAERLERAHEALDNVGLSDKASRRVGQLSGGERQRVGLARALALKPKVLVCDEPTAPLDEATSRTIAERLQAFASAGGCVVVATHDPLLIGMGMFTQTLTLEHGRACSSTS